MGNTTRNSRNSSTSEEIIPNPKKSSTVIVSPKSKSEGVKKHRLGKITKNPFFNYLRECRKHNSGMSVVEMAKSAGAVWRKMDAKQKQPYCQQACDAKKCEKHKSKCNCKNTRKIKKRYNK